MLYSRAGADSFTLFQVSKCKKLQGLFGFLFWGCFEGMDLIFWGVFCASVHTAKLWLILVHLLVNRLWIAIGVGVFWLVGFHLGFLNENLFSSEEACRDIYIFINILTTERPTMRLRVHSFCKVVVRCEISILVLSIKTNREELNCRYAKLMYFGFLELKNSVNGKLIRKKKREFLK